MTDSEVEITTVFKLLDPNNRMLLTVEGNEVGEVSIEDLNSEEITSEELARRLRLLADALVDRYKRALSPSAGH